MIICLSILIIFTIVKSFPYFVRSLGICIIEMATGGLPTEYNGKSEEEVIYIWVVEYLFEWWLLLFGVNGNKV